MLAEKLGVELDVTGLVDTVDVTESSGDREVGGDGRKGSVDIVDVLGLSVETSVVDTSVVNTVLLTTGDTDLHLEPETKGSHALEVLDTSGNVLLLALLGEVKHVRRKKRLAVSLEVFLVSLEHAVEPWQELGRAVVGVKNYRTTGLILGAGLGEASVRQNDLHAVLLGDSTDVVGRGNGTKDGGLLLVVGEALAGEVRASTLRDLEDYGSLDVPAMGIREKEIRGQGDENYRAASSTALAVEEEVTF